MFKCPARPSRREHATIKNPTFPAMPNISPTPQDQKPKLTRVRTNVSRAYWCDPCDHYLFKPAQINILDKDQPHTCWLDHLLDGGLVLPGGAEGKHERALTLLLSGSPGSGKSTLALEMCTRWSKQHHESDNPNEILKMRGWNTLYVTTEAHGPWLVDKAAQAGWPAGKVGVYSLDTALKSVNTSGDGFVHVWPIMDDTKIISQLKTLTDQAGGPDGTMSAFQTTIHFLHLLAERIAPARGTESSSQPATRPYDVLVFDSANTVADKGTRALLFHYFRQLVTSGPKIVIIIADAQSHGGDEDFWDFMSDVVIRLTRKVSEERYMVRTIEVTKARYQSHVWGVHQLKPYGASDIAAAGLPALPIAATKIDREDYYRKASERMRAHPYRQRGGIFVFPSIHYILSVLKKQAPFTRAESVSSAVPGLTPLLRGYPRHRCTALIGCRGGHKSHLAFVETMDRLIKGSGTVTDSNQKYSDRALIITLRDDEGMTRETLQRILVERYNSHLALSKKDSKVDRLRMEAADKLLREWELKGMLEISYFPPGYITPEEFFHRVLVSLNRLKRPIQGHESDKPHVTVVVNSLDQLSSRFPLCASQAIFVPGIIQVLSSEGASSFFIAAEEPGHPGLYGLDTMAELILEFSLKSLKADSYLEAVAKRFKLHVKHVRTKLDATTFGGGNKRVSAVIVRVARYAGGQAAGAGGILELLDENRKHPLCRVTEDLNLTCVPL